MTAPRIHIRLTGSRSPHGALREFTRSKAQCGTSPLYGMHLGLRAKSHKAIWHSIRATILNLTPMMGPRIPPLLLASTALLVLGSLPGSAGPDGAVVVGGQATVTAAGTANVQVNQT